MQNVTSFNNPTDSETVAADKVNYLHWNRLLFLYFFHVQRIFAEVPCLPRYHFGTFLDYHRMFLFRELELIKEIYCSNSNAYSTCKRKVSSHRSSTSLAGSELRYRTKEENTELQHQTLCSQRCNPSWNTSSVLFFISASPIVLLCGTVVDNVVGLFVATL